MCSGNQRVQEGAMLLDYNPSKSSYFILLPRSEKALIKTLMKKEGFDFSLSASTSGQAVLATETPYAAAQYAKFGTPRAKAILKPITDEIDASWNADCNDAILSPMGRELRPFQRAS